MDFMITGNFDGYSSFSGIYKNLDSNKFKLLKDSIVPVFRSSVEWGDYNNDNYMDIVLSGSLLEYPSLTQYTKIYSNNKGLAFSEITINIAQADEGAISWGDYNNDGNLDILQSGLSEWGDVFTNLYKNYGNGYIVNQAAI
ncbi:MAG: VCBS repeat-containing protein [Bacteroidales bacterium]|nr:VCBS repeat-containing protein [Bacteroidales bacterium]